MNPSVLFIAPSAYPLGGVQTWLDYVMLGIQEQNCKSTLALTNGFHHNANVYLDKHPFRQTILISSPTGSIQGRIEALEQLLLSLNPDIIIVVNIVDVYQAVNNLRSKKLIKSRVITSIHGIHPGLIDDISTNRNIIDAVISTNQLTRKLVEGKTNIDSTRSFYASYGVAKTQIESPFKPQSNTLTIAYVGRIEEDQKRIFDLIAILSKCLNEIDNIVILIAGDGPENHVVKNWISNSQHQANIHHLGILTTEELQKQVYTKADILLLTSHWETGPIVAWEAMSHGLTLVSSKYLGCLEEGSLIDGENCLLFDIGDINQAVNKIKFATDDKKRLKLSENAYELVNNKYSINNSILLWSECIKSVYLRKPKPYTKIVQANKDKGRLPFVIGQTLAERIRKLFGIKFKHNSAGGEWPHSYSNIESHSSQLNDYIKNT